MLFFMYLYMIFSFLSNLYLLGIWNNHRIQTFRETRKPWGPERVSQLLTVSNSFCQLWMPDYMTNDTEIKLTFVLIMLKLYQ